MYINKRLLLVRRDFSGAKEPAVTRIRRNSEATDSLIWAGSDAYKEDIFSSYVSSAP